MAFFEITHSEKYRFATLHSYGCTFDCDVCSYKLRSGPNGTPGLISPRPMKFLRVPEIKEALLSVSVDTVYFMGGEPTVSKELPEVLEFAKKTMGVRTFLGHTNGSRLPMPNLDGANVGLKAWDEKVHLEYTGKPKQLIFDNFVAAVAAGMDIRANVVFVPGLVDLDQVEAIAEWVAAINPDIPFHVMGYIPVPGLTYPRPTKEQMARAEELCRTHLHKVGSSHLSSEQALDLSSRDDRFAVRKIA